MNTVKVKRVDILADEPLLPQLVEAIQRSGAHGHTVLSALSGAGHCGRWHQEGLTGVNKVMVFAIVSADAAGRLVDSLTPLLDSHGLLLTLTDVEVVRDKHF